MIIIVSDVSTIDNHVLTTGDLSRSKRACTGKQLSPHLRSDLVVHLYLHDILEFVELLPIELELIPLCKGEKRLVPQHWQLALLVSKRVEVVHQCREDTAGKSILLVE